MWGKTSPHPNMPRASYSKSRGWCFTLNNYSDADIDFLESVECQYLIYGKEVAPTTGTPHLQGYCHWASTKTLRQAKLCLGPRYHLEPRMGTIEEAVQYCKKDGDFKEKGKIAMRSCPTEKDLQWKEIIHMAETGSLDDLKEHYPRQFLQYYKTLMSIRAYKSKPLDGELLHEWWYGPTGTGKSRKIWDDYPDHYAKPLNKWWDGYHGQEVVAIEEWEPKNECTASKLKIWADRYPFPAEIKGGTIERVRPKKIIVTSNYTIEECFPRPEDHLPLKRRFKEVFFPFPWAPSTGAPLSNPSDLTLGDLLETNVVDFEDQEAIDSLLQLSQ